MGNLTAVFGKNCNYMYHMLSISNCGYDNEYGKKHRMYHAESDLQILKKYEEYITVSSGKHCGELYGICITTPALCDDSVLLTDYFEAIINMFEESNLDKNLEKYQLVYETVFSPVGVTINAESQREFYNAFISKKQEIIDILRVMLNNYSIYSDKVWDISKRELAAAVDELNTHLSKIDYIEEWEKALNCKYKYDNFYAVICNSLQNGAQCLDISYNKDIFNIPDNCSSAVKLINHEIGIYLLKEEILNETEAFKDYK